MTSVGILITLMIKSYIFKPAFSAADPGVIELINTGPLPLTTIPCDPPSPGETLIDLRKATTKLVLLTLVFNRHRI